MDTFSNVAIFADCVSLMFRVVFYIQWCKFHWWKVLAIHPQSDKELIMKKKFSYLTSYVFKRHFLLEAD